MKNPEMPKMIPEKNPEAKHRETQGRAQKSHREEPRSRNKTQNLSVNPRPPRTGAYSTPHVCGREAVPPQPRCHCADGYGVMPGSCPDAAPDPDAQVLMVRLRRQQTTGVSEVVR